MGASLPGARVSLAVIASPASVAALTLSPLRRLNAAFCAGVAGASTRT